MFVFEFNPNRQTWCEKFMGTYPPLYLLTANSKLDEKFLQVIAVVVTAKKSCLGIFAASLHVISAMTGNLPFILKGKFLDLIPSVHIKLYPTSPTKDEDFTTSPTFFKNFDICITIQCHVIWALVSNQEFCCNSLVACGLPGDTENILVSGWKKFTRGLSYKVSIFRQHFWSENTSQ